jgi:hypothetical protein
MTTQKADLLEQRTQLVAYLVSKLKANDLHAVQDAASDIREIDAKLQVLAEMDEHQVETDPRLLKRIG